MVDSGSMIVDLEPHAEKVLEIPYTLPKECVLGCYLNLSLQKDGYEFAVDQHELEVPQKVAELCQRGDQLTFCEEGEEILIRGEGFTHRFNTHYGRLTDINGLTDGGAEITAWRAPTDNERHMKMKWGYFNKDNRSGENLNRGFSKVYSCVHTGNTISVTGNLSGVARKPFFQYTAVYRFFDDGSIEVGLHGKVREECVWLPRMGFTFFLPKSSAGFRYYGMGPGETYCDLHHYAKVGMYESNAAAEYVPYIVPQEHGNHYKTLYLQMENGLTFTSQQPFEINVSEYTTHALTEAMHTDELVKADTIQVRVDYKDSGIGSASCGPQLLEEYRLDEKKIDFTFRIALK